MAFSDFFKTPRERMILGHHRGRTGRERGKVSTSPSGAKGKTLLHHREDEDHTAHLVWCTRGGGLASWQRGNSREI